MINSKHVKTEKSYLHIIGAFCYKSNNVTHIYCDNDFCNYMVIFKDLCQTVGMLRPDIINWLVNDNTKIFTFEKDKKNIILKRVTAPKSGFYKVQYISTHHRDER